MAIINWKTNEQRALEEAALLLAQQKQIEKEALIASTPEKVSTLERENMNLMLAMAETYEQMYNENMSLMLAVAEMYEELQALKGGLV